MRVVVQRVARAQVDIDGDCVGQVERGLMVLVGFTHGDTRRDLEYIARDSGARTGWALEMWDSGPALWGDVTAGAVPEPF